MSINGDTGTVLAQGKTVEVRIDTFLVAPVKIGVYGSIKGCSVSSDTAWSTNIAMSVTTCPLADPVYDLEPDSVCLGSVVQYSILPIPGAETYEWTLPEGLSELTTGNTGVVVTNDNKIVVMVDKAGKLNALLVKAKSPTAPESVSTPTNSIMVFDVSPTAVISPETTCPGDSGMIWINKNKLFSYETIITGAASIDSSNIDTVKIVWGNNPQGTISVKAKKTSIGCSVEKKYNINLSMGDTKMTCPADEEVTFNMDVNATSVYKYVIKDSLAPVIESRCGWTSLTNDYDSLSNAIRDTITIQLPATMSNNDKANQSITWTLVDKAGTTHTCTTTISVITSRELTPYSAFSPNGDGVNDRFKIGNLNYYPGATVQIFNRWGELVYNCKKDCDLESNGWDGRDMKGNPVPFDSYHYIIYQNGKMIKMGSLVIVR